MLLAGAAAAAAAATLWVSGGGATTIGGVRVSARSPVPATAVALAVLAGWFILAGRVRGWASDAIWLDGWLARRSRVLVLGLATLTILATWSLGTSSASGADASGYLSQAQLLASLSLSHHEPLASRAGWSDGPVSLAPLGWLADGAARQVPTYPAGLPLLMAGMHAVGGAPFAFAVVVLSFGVALWSASHLARHLGGPVAAVVTAAWLASSPVWLFHALQPMSDVPAAAAWLLCWSLVVVTPASHGFHAAGHRAPLLAGLAAAVAVTLRPNLAPLALLPCLFLLVRAPTKGSPHGSPVRAWRQAWVWFALPVACAGLLVAWLHWYWYGSPLRSGYGTAAEIYAWGHVRPNLGLYTSWLVEIEGPWLLAAPVALLVTRRRGYGWLLTYAAVVISAYLAYAVFERWTYLRFLLPALAMAVIGVSCLIAWAIGRLPASLRAMAVIVAVVLVGATGLRAAGRNDVWGVAARQARAPLAGHRLAALVPPGGVIVAGEQSGAMRYYTTRSILRWDLIDAATWSAAMDALTTERAEIWIALDEWEEELFRRKFAGHPFALLDWPPHLDAGTTVRTRAWRVASRAAYLAGEEVRTERLR